MSFVASDLKDVLTINFKARHDSFTDQYCRMFMVKLLLACTVVTGLYWYSDKVNCIITEETDPDGFDKFAASTCWIQGLYVYREMGHKLNQSSYYGIPKDMDSDGLMDGRYLCRTTHKFHSIVKGYECKPMEKTYFLQYQWMPFYIATLALLYYIPYLFFKVVNNDLINLKNSVEEDDSDIDVDNIVKYYFPEHKKKKRKAGCLLLTMRQCLNILIKVIYIAVNFVCFFGTDNLLYGRFKSYGWNWIDWSQLENTVAFDYMGSNDSPKPGNELLPPFGYCEVYSSSKDIKTSFANKHKLLCEMSPHILYQYVFIVLWFAFMIGICLTLIGLIVLLVNYLIGMIGIRKHCKNSDIKKLFDSLTFREVEYLEFLRKKNILIYGEVLEKLKERALGTPPQGSDDGSYGKSDVPMYPLKRKAPNAPY